MDIYSTVNYMKQNHKTIFDLNIRVAYYVRVSTLKEEQDSSVEHQIEHFENMIKEHSNWTYIEGYVDRVRGESAVNRENFMRMIEDGKSDKFDLILTKEVSRFARNTIDSLTYTRELLRSGVGVLFQNDNICTVDSDAEFRLTIMASIAQDEVRKLSERVKFGHKQSIEKGVVMGNSRIYGYDKYNGKLIVNEKEAEIVRFIFEQYATGMYALREIQRQLTARGFTSRNGTPISHNTISGILNNPKYKGYYCGNKVKIADYRTKEQVFLPESEWVMYKDESGETVPAIVSEELWDKANRLFKARSEEVKNRGRGQKATSVLSGKIFCTHCQAPFWRTSYSHRLHKEQNIYQYVCREKRSKGSKSCPTFAIYETEIYDVLSKCFVMNLKNLSDYTDKFISLCRAALSDNSSKESIDKIIAQQNNIERKKEMLLDLYMSGDISKSDFKKRNDSLCNEFDELEHKRQSLIDTQLSYRDIEKRLEKVRKTIDDIFNGDLTQKEVDVLVGMFLERIEVTSIDKKNMELNIIMNFGEAHYSFGRSSGIILQKILPEQQSTVERLFGKNTVLLTYHIHTSVIIN